MEKLKFKDNNNMGITRPRVISQSKINTLKVSLFEGMMLDLQDSFQHRHRFIRGGFNFIPIGTDKFIRQLDFVIRGIFKSTENNEKIRFLDAGCGVGVTVCLARKMGLNGRGIEINPKLIEISSYMFNERSRITKGDILKFSNYSNYDIIYYYRPFESITLEEKFEEKVEKEIKSDGIIIANWKVSNEYKDNGKFKEYHMCDATILKKR